MNGSYKIDNYIYIFNSGKVQVVDARPFEWQGSP